MKESYLSPSIEWLEIRVENGFAATQSTEQMDPQEEEW